MFTVLYDDGDIKEYDLRLKRWRFESVDSSPSVLNKALNGNSDGMVGGVAMARGSSIVSAIPEAVVRVAGVICHAFSDEDTVFSCLRHLTETSMADVALGDGVSAPWHMVFTLYYDFVLSLKALPADALCWSPPSLSPAPRTVGVAESLGSGGNIRSGGSLGADTGVGRSSQHGSGSGSGSGSGYGGGGGGGMWSLEEVRAGLDSSKTRGEAAKQAVGGGLTKRDVIEKIQSTASANWLKAQKLHRPPDILLKSMNIERTIAAYDRFLQHCDSTSIANAASSSSSSSSASVESTTLAKVEAAAANAAASTMAMAVEDEHGDETAEADIVVDRLSTRTLRRCGLGTCTAGVAGRDGSAAAAAAAAGGSSAINALLLLKALHRLYGGQDRDRDAACVMVGVGADAEAGGPSRFGVTADNAKDDAMAIDGGAFERAGPAEGVQTPAAVATAWLNVKLGRQLEKQMQDPLAVAARALPSWCDLLLAEAQFAFSLSQRQAFLKLTGFGVSRAVSRIQAQLLLQDEASDDHADDYADVGAASEAVSAALEAAAGLRAGVTALSGGRSGDGAQETSLFRIGGLRHERARVRRSELLADAETLMEHHAGKRQVLELAFEGEAGVGIGVTREYYSECAAALMRQEMNSDCPMWLDESAVAALQREKGGRGGRGGAHGPGAEDSTSAGNVTSATSATSSTADATNATSSASSTTSARIDTDLSVATPPVKPSYVTFSKGGLFPFPMSVWSNTTGTTAGTVSSQMMAKVCRRYRFLGRLLGKALQDGHFVPLPICRPFLSHAVHGTPITMRDFEELPDDAPGVSLVRTAYRIHAAHAGIQGVRPGGLGCYGFIRPQ